MTLTLTITLAVTLTLPPRSLLPQIKSGLVPAGSAANLEEEGTAWATRVVRFNPEYKFALAEAVGVQPQLSRRKMPHLMAQFVREVADEARRQGAVNLDGLGDARLAQLLPSEEALQESLVLCHGRGRHGGGDYEGVAGEGLRGARHRAAAGQEGGARGGGGFDRYHGRNEDVQ